MKYMKKNINNFINSIVNFFEFKISFIALGFLIILFYYYIYILYIQYKFYCVCLKLKNNNIEVTEMTLE